MSRHLLMALQSELERVSDPKKAPQMQAYMKSAMAFYGVQSKLARQVFRKAFAGVEFGDAAAWMDAVLYIWRNARCCEEWYGAIALCGSRQADAIGRSPRLGAVQK